jgi:CHASE3 domain sensor protein
MTMFNEINTFFADILPIATFVVGCMVGARYASWLKDRQHRRAMRQTQQTIETARKVLA